MPTTTETPFGITREEVLDLAATKFAEMFFAEAPIEQRINTIIEKHVLSEINKGLKDRVDVFLNEEMTRLLSREIMPVDIWGERAGSPTTIREVLATRAREFWDVKVDADGKESSYHGSPRHKQLMQQILKEEFAQAVKENVTLIVAEFKAALKTSTSGIIADHIDRLIVKR